MRQWIEGSLDIYKVSMLPKFSKAANIRVAGLAETHMASLCLLIP